MELIYKENEPRILTNKRPRALYVVGADLDIDLVKSLVPEDQVLMEVNGARYWTALKNPLVAEYAWIVVENNYSDIDGKPVGQLVLRHQKVKQPLTLDYRDLVPHESPKGKKIVQPAVWAITNPTLQEGILYIVLQMVAYRLPEDRVSAVFPPMSEADTHNFMEALEDDRVKAGLFEHWSQVFGKSVDEQGWHLRSVKRFALRAQVTTKIANALRKADYESLLRVNDGDLLNMRRECHWMKYLLRQNNLIAHDAEAVYQKTNA